jgi:hypothetical protein
MTYGMKAFWLMTEEFMTNTHNSSINALIGKGRAIAHRKSEVYQKGPG